MAQEKRDKDVTRFTLQSFVGPHLSKLNMDERDRNAIERLISFRDDNFDVWCEDVANEIHRRSGMQYSSDRPIHPKLARLDDNRFRILATDTLLVYNFKNPGTKVLEINEFLDNLQGLIDDLKAQSEGEQFNVKIREMGFLNAMVEYNKYVKRMNVVDEAITAEVEAMIEKEIDSRAESLLECLSYPQKLIERLDREPAGKNEEYLFHRRNILELLGEAPAQPEHSNADEEAQKHNEEHGDKKSEEKSGTIEKPPQSPQAAAGSATKSRIIKGEIMQILSLYMERACVPAAHIDTQHPELIALIKVLDRIQDDLNGGTCVNLKDMAHETSGLLSSLMEGLSTDARVNSEDISKLELHRVAIENLANSVTKLDAFKHIIHLVRDIQSILEGT